MSNFLVTLFLQLLLERSAEIVLNKLYLFNHKGKERKACTGGYFPVPQEATFKLTGFHCIS